MSAIRRVTVRQDKKGNLFVKFRIFNNRWLIVRPGRKDYVFELGDKVNVTYQDCMNLSTGKFTVKLVGDKFTTSVWEGPFWNGKEWVGEQIKSV